MEALGFLLVVLAIVLVSLALLIVGFVYMMKRRKRQAELNTDHTNQRQRSK